MVQTGGQTTENENDSDHGKLKNAGSGTHVLKSDVKLQAQKKEYVSQYRPVQILFRSMLEMIPVQNLNPPISCTDNKKPSVRGEISMNESPCMNVLAMGFGQERLRSHVFFPWASSQGPHSPQVR